MFDEDWFEEGFLDAAVDLLIERVWQQECLEMDQAHVIVYSSSDGTHHTCLGPYSTGLEAVLAAELRAQREDHEEASLTTSVVPLRTATT